MGHGGVACMPLQQQQHVIERLPTAAAEKALSGNGFGSGLLKAAGKRKKKKVNVKKKVAPVAKKVVKSELAVEGVGSRSGNDVESGEVCGEMDEVEEGELGTLGCELENGEFVLPEKPVMLTRRSEIENGEIVCERWKKGEVERGEFVSGKWRKEEDVEKGEIVPEKGRKGETEKWEYGSCRGGMKSDIEKGEFIPDRWHRVDMGRDDYGCARIRRYQPGRDKGWKNERERTPPSGRYYIGDEYFRKKELNRSGSQHAKSAPRWDSGQERNIRISSKIVNDEKNEHSSSRTHMRDYSSGNRLKRHGNEPEGCERNYGE